jgi:serine/threonine protein kinase/Tfp pilus assembly protein PilF
MESESVFGVEPEQLNELLSVGEDDVDDSPAESESSHNDRPSEEKAESKPAVNAFVEQPGSWIGPYKLLRVLGEGGMGIAYLAEQKRPMRRQVAIKVIKPGMDSRCVVSRFEAERQALALLDHPNIAHVYDAGTTELGRPYFVMEYVKGLSITDYCDHHKLTIKHRLVLFQQICHAIQHAHQKGIIHRDIKPSNILVSVENDQPTPKIIDFGVAKAIGRPLTDRTVFTEDSHLLGTPEYMSPEQADMATEDIDTRSDVYSLGVLLYVLLTGVLPFDVHSLRDSGIEKIRRTIRETNPKTPSTRLTSLGEEAEKVAEQRSTQISTLTKHLKNELEWIPLKAMRKERSERYRSASEFADDIENYLNGVPLIAGPPTTIYRLKKLLRRHKSLVASLIAVFAVLTAGVIVSSVFALKARRQAQRSDAIANFFMVDVLGYAEQIRGRDAMVIDIIEAAAAKLDGDTFNGQPLLEASVRGRLAAVYDILGYYRQSIPHKARQYEILRQYGQHGAVVKNYLAIAYRRSGEYEQAESLFKQLISELHDTSILWRPSRCNLAHVYYGQGRYKESERLLLDAMNESLENQTKRGKSLRDWYALELAKVYRSQGRYMEAEQEFIRAIEVDKKDKVWGKLPGMSGLARLYADQERYQKAEELFRKTIEQSRLELPGKGHPVTLSAMSGLAILCTKQASFNEAESLFKEALEGQELKLGPNHPETLETINAFGVLRRKQQRYDEAESMLSQALDGRQRKLGADHPACFESMHELAVLYKEQELYERAEPLLRDAIKGRREKLGITHPHTLESIKTLIKLYEAWGKSNEADELRPALIATEGPEK